MKIRSWLSARLDEFLYACLIACVVGFLLWLFSSVLTTVFATVFVMLLALLPVACILIPVFLIYILVRALFDFLFKRRENTPAKPANSYSS